MVFRESDRLMTVAVTDNKAFLQLPDRPGRREAARGGIY